ncbi:uncharacterized protein LOC134706011 [Mytilus trossulus]|uniref:uncharacterized protein LOC134706011 n=1 Tax=Mytilus trossulus TaxID=6551 RepID=UPI003003BAEF
MDLNKLKSIRKANRSVVTRHLRKIDDLKNEAELARVDLFATFESVEQKKKLLEDLNQQIISAIDAEDIEEEILNTDEYTLDLETKLKHLRIFIQSLDNSNNHTNQQSNSSYQILNYEASPFIPTTCIENQQQSYIAPSMSTFSNQTHHLPKLTLHNFSGNIIEWQSFWDSFESAVHMNPNLPDIQKFNYLKSQLGGEASHTIDGFALTNANYKEAINVL